jgi:hypothetical protein
MQLITQFTGETKQRIDDLASAGIGVKVRKMDNGQYSCRARIDDGRDPIVTYAATVDVAVRQTTDLARGTWSDLFKS